MSATTRQLRLSAAWSRHALDCTPRGITTHCNALCCRTQRFWPARAGSVPDACDNLGPDGCRLGEGRPATCHLYPLRIEGEGTRLVAHFSGRAFPVCGGCRDTGPRLIDALRPSLDLLFDPAEVAHAEREITAGRDAYLTISPALATALTQEADWEAEGTVPPARDWHATRPEGDSMSTADPQPADAPTDPAAPIEPPDPPVPAEPDAPIPGDDDENGEDEPTDEP